MLTAAIAVSTMTSLAVSANDIEVTDGAGAGPIEKHISEIIY